MTTRALLLPLDDRPCNLEQVSLLARVASIDLVTPPLGLVASQSPGHRYEDQRSWLLSELDRGNVEFVVLSLDQWVYGGLIRSRKLGIATPEALGRVTELSSIIGSHPSIRFYVSSVLLRLSVTVTAGQTEDDWRNIFRYSVLCDQSVSAPAPERQALAAELRTTLSKIPAPLLEEYLGARARNSSVNHAALALPENAAFLLFGQEDCAEYGLHRAEKAALSAAITQTSEGRRGNSLVLTGADELNSLLLLRAAMDHSGIRPGSFPLFSRWSDPKGQQRISRYEDVSCLENWELHLLPSLFTTPKPQPELNPSSGVQVHIRAFTEPGQSDLCFEQPDPLDPDAKDALRAWIRGIRPGDALLDLSHANGADPELMETLGETFGGSFAIQQLSSLSAWNTSGNRIGTLIAHLGLRVLGQKTGTFSAEADRAYRKLRWADDYLFQSRIRPLLQKEAKKRGLDPWALGSAWEEFNRLAQNYLDLELLGRGFKTEIAISLPWPRLFEANLHDLTK